MTLCLIGMATIMGNKVQAQFGFGGLTTVYDPSNYGIAVKQLYEAREMLTKAQEQIRIANMTTDQVTNIFTMQDDIRKSLLELKGLDGLEWNNLTNLFESAMLLSSDPRTYFKHDLPYVNDVYNLLNQGDEPYDTRRMYEYYFQKGTAYDPANNIGELRDHQLDQAEKRYATEMYVQQQKLQLAMQYMQRSEELVIQAEELRQKVGQSGAMSMTEGERVLAQKAASDKMVQSMQLRESANKLLLESLEVGPTQRIVDWQHRAKLLREAKSRALPMLLPGD